MRSYKEIIKELLELKNEYKFIEDNEIAVDQDLYYDSEDFRHVYNDIVKNLNELKSNSDDYRKVDKAELEQKLSNPSTYEEYSDCKKIKSSVRYFNEKQEIIDELLDKFTNFKYEEIDIDEINELKTGTISIEKLNFKKFKPILVYTGLYAVTVLGILGITKGCSKLEDKSNKYNTEITTESKVYDDESYIIYEEDEEEPVVDTTVDTNENYAGKDRDMQEEINKNVKKQENNNKSNNNNSNNVSKNDSQNRSNTDKKFKTAQSKTKENNKKVNKTIEILPETTEEQPKIIESTEAVVKPAPDEKVEYPGDKVIEEKPSNTSAKDKKLPEEIDEEDVIYYKSNKSLESESISEKNNEKVLKYSR